MRGEPYPQLEDTLDDVLFIRIAGADKQALRDAAEAERMTVSTFVRRAALEAAEAIAKD